MNSIRTIFGFVLFALASLCCAQGITTRVSVSSAGEQGNGWSDIPSINADGRFVAFHSIASNLVAGDTNGFRDVFVRDRQTGETALVSVSSTGQQGNGDSYDPSISADGRIVVWISIASNLVAGDTNGVEDVFVHDRQTGQTTRVSVSSAGAQANSYSLNRPSISADGQFVAFHSFASNLVAGDTNTSTDVFVHNRQTGETTRVSVSSSGQQANNASYFPKISGDGRFVIFDSYASNLVAGDTNTSPDAFIHDRQTGQTTLVSVSSSGQQGNSDTYYPSISEDGRFVAFTSWASNLVPGDTNGQPDVFMRDLQTGQTTRVSVSSSGQQGNDRSDRSSVSADGRFVAFQSDASNLVTGDTNGFPDAFVHNWQTGETTRVSVSSSGQQGNSGSLYPSMSGDGRFVAFTSWASNLVLGDTNGQADVFVHDLFETVGPSSFSLFRGTVVSGNLNSLLESDDDRLVMRPGVVLSSQESPIQLIVNATSPNSTPSRLEFSVEAHCSAPNISQRIALYNFDTQTYETLNTTTATTSDSTVVVIVTSNPGRFIGPNLELRSRVSYRANGPVLVYPWSGRVDQVKWTVVD